MGRIKLIESFKELPRKEKIRKITGLAFMVVGLLVVLSAIIVPIVNKVNNDKVVDAVKSNIPVSESPDKTESPDEVTEESAEITVEAVGEPAVDETAKRREELLAQSGCIGIIVIDKINVELAIKEGDDDETLKTSVGHMIASAPIGENGNCVLSAHHGGYYGEFFKNIEQLENEDIIQLISADGNVSKYSVYDKKKIKRTDWSVTDKLSEDLSTLTLITCVDATQEERIIVSAIKFE